MEKRPAHGETTLRAGETMRVFGKGRFAGVGDYRITTDLEKGFVDLAVVFGRTGSGARYTSAFVKIRVGD